MTESNRSSNPMGTLTVTSVQSGLIEKGSMITIGPFPKPVWNWWHPWRSLRHWRQWDRNWRYAVSVKVTALATGRGGSGTYEIGPTG